MQIYGKSIPFSNMMLRERMAGGGRLLDVGGAANPQRANAMSDIFSEVIIADPGKPRRPLQPNVHFVECCIENIGADMGRFDHILMSNVLEHVQYPAQALRSVKKALTPSGSIHILSPNCESLNRRIGVLMGVLNDIREITAAERNIGHLHALTVADVKQMIADAELVLHECIGVFLKPAPTPEMITWPEMRIKAFFDIATEIPADLCHEVYFRAGKTSFAE